ncbi:SDR family NAD(P)-dependent oxidoreductase [Luteithermobacter gelatinilyticus]|uniref:SDR family NAD(P)-dependent oxidoreductase n=1 Tax=Luteithermobacter gelatinilyticus TaxID=2582913 RepID=UPI001107357C|nr:SDR family NAD(P)-dependent oxidoreductase [Luteithermobacter gelatinilyticus]
MTSSILITGAAKRIGRVIALTLARAGYHIHLHYHHSQNDAEQTARDIREQGGSAQLIQADLGDAHEVDNLIPALIRDSGAPPLEHVINNASRFADDTAFNFTRNSFEGHMNVNLRAPLQLARGLYRALGEDRRGSVINIIDSSVFAMNPDFFTYSLSKYGLLGATETLAMALAPRVRVNGLAPGLTLLSGDQSEENFTLAGGLNLNRQAPTPEDIATSCLHLIRTPSINAAVLPLDGGQKNLRLNRDVARIAEDLLGTLPGHNRPAPPNPTAGKETTPHD